MGTIWHVVRMSTQKDPMAMDNLLRDYGDSGLRKIVRQAKRLLLINQILKECLPENLRTHCQATQMTATEFTILVDGAAWLTHLRYFKPQLLERLRKYPQCAYLKEVQYRIQPVERVRENIEEEKTVRVLSLENKELLKNTAETVSHPLLKAALFKLTMPLTP